jgi:hypothetical protein
VTRTLLIVVVGLLAGCGGSGTSKLPAAPVTSRGDLKDTATLCDAKNLRVSRPSWVSPITSVSMSGVRVTNSGSRSCKLVGWPHVVAIAQGLPSVVAVPGACGLSPPNRPPAKMTIRPSGWASVLFAVSHSCEPPPAHHYDRLVMTIPGRKFAVALASEDSVS